MKSSNFVQYVRNRLLELECKKEISVELFTITMNLKDTNERRIRTLNDCLIK